MHPQPDLAGAGLGQGPIAQRQRALLSGLGLLQTHCSHDIQFPAGGKRAESVAILPHIGLPVNEFSRVVADRRAGAVSAAKPGFDEISFLP
jgi:hypothetical protein